MIIKIKQILDEEKNLAELANLDLPIKVAYWIKRIYKKVEAEIVTFSEQKNALITKVGKKLENGTFEVRKDSKEWEGYLEEINKLLDTEIDIDFTPIKLDTLEKVTIKPNLLIDWIFEE